MKELAAKLHHAGDEPHILREILRAHQALMAGFARGVGVPAARFGLMRLLALEGEIGTMALARRLGVNAAAVTHQLNEMEKEKLILRIADPADGRRSGVALSAAGKRLFEDIHRRSHVLEQRLSEAVGARELAEAATTLQKIRNFIEEEIE